MEAARQMRLRYGVTTIYLATDSGVALASLQRELVTKDNFTILSLPGLDRGVFDSNLYIEFRVQMQLVPFPASPSCDAHAFFLRHTRLFLCATHDAAGPCLGLRARAASCYGCCFPPRHFTNAHTSRWIGER